MAQVASQIERVEGPPAGRYELDPAHTAVEFVARHMLSKVRGRFTDFSGWIEVAEDPAGSSAQVEIRAASIQTNQEMRDGHLRSPDFLDVETYPTLGFRSRELRPTGRAGFEIDGELTIKDVTRPVTLDAEYLGLETDPYGNRVIAFTARTTIDREDWGITWNQVLETGGLLVAKKVDIELEVEAKLAG
jgi:polyisoprenoid-binding protein YceI